MGKITKITPVEIKKYKPVLLEKDAQEHLKKSLDGQKMAPWIVKQIYKTFPKK